MAVPISFVFGILWGSESLQNLYKDDPLEIQVLSYPNFFPKKFQDFVFSKLNVKLQLTTVSTSENFLDAAKNSSYDLYAGFPLDIVALQQLQLIRPIPKEFSQMNSIATDFRHVPLDIVEKSVQEAGVQRKNLSEYALPMFWGLLGYLSEDSKNGAPDHFLSHGFAKSLYANKKYKWPEDEIRMWIWSWAMDQRTNHEKELLQFFSQVLQPKTISFYVQTLRQASTHQALNHEKVPEYLRPSYLRKFQLSQLKLSFDYNEKEVWSEAFSN